MARQGLIIKIEGVDGCGKSSLAGDVARHFQKNYAVVVTREYKTEHDVCVQLNAAGRTVSEILYEIALDPRLEFDDWEREVTMAVAARRHNRIVLPRLRHEYDLVVCDRSVLTNYAYGCDLGPDYRWFVEFFLDSVSIADRVFWIDANVEESYARRSGSFAKNQPSTKDNVEHKGIDFQRAVAREFARLAKKTPLIVTINGRRDYQSVLDELITEVDDLLVRTLGSDRVAAPGR